MKKFFAAERKRCQKNEKTTKRKSLMVAKVYKQTFTLKEIRYGKMKKAKNEKSS